MRTLVEIQSASVLSALFGAFILWLAWQGWKNYSASRDAAKSPPIMELIVAIPAGLVFLLAPFIVEF